MVITYRSSRQKELIVIDREEDGRQRVAKAIQSDYNTRHWSVSLEHPNGQVWSGVCTGNKSEVGIGLTKMLADHEMEFTQDRANGDRRPAEQRDRNVKIADDGRDIGAPQILPRR